MAQAGVDPRIGTELAGYRIDALAGRGGMGVVYRAHHLHLDRRVALKVLVPELAEDLGFRERFLRESRVAASLDHQGVIPIYDAGEAEGVLYIAMRYVEGTDLRSLLASEGRLDSARALAIVGQVAGALDAAHARGLVHRDVKPANILIAEETVAELQVYLSDFGLTKATGSGPSLTGTGQFVGTVDYASPEQIQGEKVDGRADQYALACVLQECLTGEPPFVRDSQLALLFAHVTDEPTPPSAIGPDLPVELDAVLAAALAKEPEDRYDSCRELVQAARGALGVSSAVDRPATGPVAAPAPDRRRRRRLLLIAALLVAIAAAAAIAVLLTTGDDGGGEAAPTTIAENTLSSIDPETNAFQTTLAVGARPEAVATGPDGVWVANFDSRTVVRVDPETSTAGTPIGSGGTPTGIAVGEGAVWVTNAFDGVVTRIDPSRNAIDDSIEVGSGTEAIAVGEGSVWVARSLDASLLRIDPATNEVADTFPVGDGPAAVAVGAGSVWVANAGDSTVSRVDPVTGDVVTIGLRFPPGAIAFGESGVWVANEQDDSVSRIDPETDRVAATVSVGDGPAGLAVTGDAVWVTNLLGRSISRIDPATATPVATVDVGAGPDGIAVDEAGTVWFTAHAP